MDQQEPVEQGPNTPPVATGLTTTTPSTEHRLGRKKLFITILIILLALFLAMVGYVLLVAKENDVAPMPNTLTVLPGLLHK